jgi:hypothetical protein
MVPVCRMVPKGKVPSQGSIPLTGACMEAVEV